MKRLRFEWDGFRTCPGMNGPELAATLAELRITLDGTPVTLVHDHQAQSTRPAIIVPLYSLAEWAATNWWCLLHECEVPSRASPGFEGRHNARSANDGYAWPDLEIRPAGRLTQISCKPRDLRNPPLSFLSEMDEWVETEDLRAELARLIEGVLARLANQQVPETHLEKEWRAIAALTAQETDFCIAAASMGLDPFHLPEGAGPKLLEAARETPEDVHEDLFQVADLEALKEQTDWIRTGVKECLKLPLDELGVPNDLKLPAKPERLPHEQGYDAAKAFRAGCGLKRSQDFWSWWDRVEDDLRKKGTSSTRVPSLCAIASRKRGVRALYLNRIWEDQPNSRDFCEPSFAFCRALLELFRTGAGEYALVTDSRSERQRRNRAFAAELLAPAEELRRKLPSDRVGDEEVDRLARDFRVSSFVIRHQIENHRLGRILPA